MIELMKYYDVADASNEWFDFNETIKPVRVSVKSIPELKKETRQEGLILLEHPNPKIFRYAVEKSLVDLVLPDRSGGRDYAHHKRTLLNNVNLKLMSKNHVSYAFTSKELRDHHGLERAITWGRMKYEAGLCVKKKVPIILCTNAQERSDLVSRHSLIGLSETLGLRPEQAKQSLNHAQERILNRT